MYNCPLKHTHTQIYVECIEWSHDEEIYKNQARPISLPITHDHVPSQKRKHCVIIVRFDRCYIVGDATSLRTQLCDSFECTRSMLLIGTAMTHATASSRRVRRKLAEDGQCKITVQHRGVVLCSSANCRRFTVFLPTVSFFSQLLEAKKSQYFLSRVLIILATT